MKDDTPLEDAKSLAEYRIENDDVLALTYKLPGKSTSSRNPNPDHARMHARLTPLPHNGADVPCSG